MIFWKMTVSFFSFICVLIPGIFSIEIRKDPSMREGEPSFIYCDVGTITTSVVVYTRPSNIKATCLGPGNPCVSSDYTATQNTSGMLVTIAAVDSARETGTWYCEQTPDESNDLTLNNKKIGGNLVLGFPNAGPTESVVSYTATMVLSCIDTTPSYGFSYTVNGSSPKPISADSNQTLGIYDGTTCEAGNTFYQLDLTASNSLGVFNNKQDVKFTFTYYGTSITTTFSVNFLEAVIVTTTTETPPVVVASRQDYGVTIAFVTGGGTLLICITVKVIVIRKHPRSEKSQEKKHSKRWRHEHEDKSSKEYQDLVKDFEIEVKKTELHIIFFEVKSVKKAGENEVDVSYDSISSPHVTAKGILHLIVSVLSVICILVGVICLITVLATNCPLDQTNCTVNLALSIVALLLGAACLAFSWLLRDYHYDWKKYRSNRGGSDTEMQPLQNGDRSDRHRDPAPVVTVVRETNQGNNNSTRNGGNGPNETRNGGNGPNETRNGGNGPIETRKGGNGPSGTGNGGKGANGTGNTGNGANGTGHAGNGPNGTRNGENGPNGMGNGGNGTGNRGNGPNGTGNGGNGMNGTGNGGNGPNGTENRGNGPNGTGNGQNGTEEGEIKQTDSEKKSKKKRSKKKKGSNKIKDYSGKREGYETGNTSPLTASEIEVESSTGSASRPLPPIEHSTKQS